jgi:hypothetical protein
MKKVAFILAVVLGLAVNAMADNVIPATAHNVAVSFNGSNHLVVSVGDAESTETTVRIYNSSMELVHSAKLGADNSKEFSLAQLPVGLYLVRLEQNGAVIHTEMVKNLK